MISNKVKSSKCLANIKPDDRSGSCTRTDFGSLVAQHGKYIKAFIAKRTWFEEDIEDIYQITLMEAFKSYKNFRDESHPRTWICGVASKVLSNFVRKKLKNIHELTDDVTSLIEKKEYCEDYELSTFRNPDESYEYFVLAKHIENVYYQLPPEMRDVFETIVSDGISYEDASKLHNIPTGTVRSRVSRARDRMKTAYMKV